MGLPQWLSGKESACSERDLGSIPGLGRSPGEGHGFIGAQQATVHWVTRRWTRMKRLCMHACTPWSNDSAGNSEQSLSALSPYSSAWMTGFCHPHYLSAQSSCWVQPTEDSSRLVVLFRNLQILEQWLLFSCSVMSNSATPWTVACQAPLSMGFFRQEYWGGLPFPSPEESSQPGLLHWQVDSLLLNHQGSPKMEF